MKRHPVLTERDLSLFRFLHSYGLLKTSDLARRFFLSVAPTTMFRRLRRLEEQGLLVRMHGLLGGELAWRVTEEAAALVTTKPPKRYFPKQSLEHDLQLVDLRLALEEAGVSHSWVPEHDLRRQTAQKYGTDGKAFKTVPDGLMAANFEDEVQDVAIELELHLKNRSRYERIFSEYRFNQNLAAVWYFVSTKALGKRWRHEWNLKPEQVPKMERYFKECPGFEPLYRFKQDLMQLLLKKHQTRKGAAELIPQLLWHMNELLESPWEALKTFGQTLQSWLEPIVRMWRFTKTDLTSKKWTQSHAARWASSYSAGVR